MTDTRRVDAAPTRARIHELQAAGLGPTQIAALAGVGRNTIMRAARNETRHVDRHVADAVLTIGINAAGPPPDLADVAHHGDHTPGPEQWARHARCTTNLDWWYSDDPHQIEAALHACHTCPALRACRDWVMATEHPSRRYGIAGGMTAGQRAHLHATQHQDTDAA